MGLAKAFQTTLPGGRGLRHSLSPAPTPPNPSNFITVSDSTQHFTKNKFQGAGELAQWLRVLATLAENSGSILSTHRHL